MAPCECDTLAATAADFQTAAARSGAQRGGCGLQRRHDRAGSHAFDHGPGVGRLVGDHLEADALRIGFHDVGHALSGQARADLAALADRAEHRAGGDAAGITPRLQSGDGASNGSEAIRRLVDLGLNAQRSPIAALIAPKPKK